ncbi:MAG: J domain-containing protein [Actinobacteria bacterium]|nr:J domain-containing protein [Actinomycetota bacterium]
MKKLVTFKDIDDARKILDLPDSASMEDIKNIHRKLMLKYHPDIHHDSDVKNAYEEKTKEINHAYKIIMNYCAKYPISFNRDRVREVEEGERIEDHLRRFYGGWVTKEE